MFSRDINLVMGRLITPLITQSLHFISTLTFVSLVFFFFKVIKTFFTESRLSDWLGKFLCVNILASAGRGIDCVVSVELDLVEGNSVVWNIYVGNF